MEYWRGYMETTICNHIEIVEGIPGTVQIATCT
ncbi:hypothetical protein LCGC14_2726050, partial [marine sediment metagenome]